MAGYHLDVYVRDGKGTVYDIEIQVSDTKELPKRSRYYQSGIDMSILEKGKPYYMLPDVTIIYKYLSGK